MLLDAMNGNTYESVANRFGLNRYYIWTMINDPDYRPPTWVYNRLGYKTTRPRYRPDVALVEDGDKDIIGSLSAVERRIALIQYAEEYKW